jgi:hypothetical protein
MNSAINAQNLRLDLLAQNAYGPRFAGMSAKLKVFSNSVKRPLSFHRAL